MTLLRLVGRQLRPYWWLVAGVVLLQTVAALANMYLPTLNAAIIDDGIAQGDLAVIWQLGGWMLLVSFGAIIATVLANFLSSRSSMSLGRDLRSAVFDRVMSFSAKEVDELGTASLITRSTNDTRQIQMLTFFALNFLVQAPVTGIGGVWLALRQEPQLAWLIAVLVPLMIGFVGLIILKAAPLFRRLQGMIDRVNQILREQISGIRVIRAFTRELHEIDRFGVVNTDLTRLNLRIGNLMILLNPVITILLNLSQVAVIWFGAALIDRGEMQVGSLTAFIAYLMQILIAVMMATFMTMMIPRAMVSAERIGEVLGTTSSVVLPGDDAVTAVDPGVLELDDVTYRYPGAETPVLDRISFTARRGETVAVIGGTGAGKTTLINLIPRLADPTGGTVRLGGVDLRDLAPEPLWSAVGLVPQRPYLFSGTVRSNLLFGRPGATEDELWDALEIAQGADFVRARPDGLDSRIAQGGTNVSGGQRQRLAIARALVARPDVYLFDDSFSALDLTTDAKLRAALAPRTRDALTVIVAQRISTITSADLILVLDDGRIVARGTHEELIGSSPVYREIARSQGREEVPA